MKKTVLFTLVLILTACASAPQTDSLLPPGEGPGKAPSMGVRESPTSTPAPTPIPAPTTHPQVIAIQEQIAASGETFALNADGRIEMQTEEGIVIVPDIQVQPDGKMTFTHNGEDFTADTETLE